MRPMPSSEMVNLISFLAVVLIFFSIDLRSRDFDVTRPAARRFFDWVSRIGGVSTAVALTLGWVDLFLPDFHSPIHIGMVAVPGSIGVLAAITLGVEMLFLPHTANRPR
ncbi:MAG TPA: hypothetical protein VK013_12050 [Myxococcaceae bacterium]|nr:hypothetical protein [Myxococcaceae bacterium]